MTGSIIVFVHPTAKPHDEGEALIAVTDGTAPNIEFVDDTKLRVRLFSGTKRNQRKEAMGVTIIYE